MLCGGLICLTIAVNRYRRSGHASTMSSSNAQCGSNETLWEGRVNVGLSPLISYLMHVAPRNGQSKLGSS